ncbi:MAG: methylated-DNA--[protein]-cysteine S-methyltransferase [Burkholderiaceae bacterium]|nr:methylated-DNA--[protein]-cysteine S-methyltransferase [Burkholderiaceae bacterium]
MNTSHHSKQRQVLTPLGELTVARSAQGLSGIWFAEQKHHPGVLQAELDEHDPLLNEAARQLGEYFAGQRKRFDLPLALEGTTFQQAVWAGLLKIPCGTTLSYGELAEAVHAPSAVRAVGAAVGRNPLSIVVPCHRVLGRDGDLTGYAGGLERKTALLELEGVLIEADA